MSGKIISLGQQSRMAWQNLSVEFTTEQLKALSEIAAHGVSVGAIRNSRYDKGYQFHRLELICVEGPGAPSIGFTKFTQPGRQVYSYERSGGDMFVSADFERVREFAKTDLTAFGDTARREIEAHASEQAAQARRSRFQLVTK